MSQQFCYPSTPNIEQEAFRLLTIYDLKVSLVRWTVVETLMQANINAQKSKQASIDTEVEALYKAIQRLRCRLMELGV